MKTLRKKSRVLLFVFFLLTGLFWLGLDSEVLPKPGVEGLPEARVPAPAEAIPALYASESTSGTRSTSSTRCASRRSRPGLSLRDGRRHHGEGF